MVRSLSALLLRPAVAVLDRLRLARKLVLIALVLIAPALYATWQFRAQQNDAIAFSSKERVGVAEIAPAGRLLTELADARALAVRSAAGDATATTGLPAARKSVAVAVAALDAVDRRQGPRLGTDAMWKRLQTSIRATVAARPTDAAATLAAYGRLTAATRALIVQAGNASNLILDPDLDSYYVMDALVNEVPLALDTAGRVTSREIAMVDSGHSSEAAAHRPRGRPGRDGERRGRRPLGPEDRLRGHGGPPAAEDPQRARGPDLRLDRRRSASSSRVPSTADPTGRRRRSSARTPSPAPPRCRASSPPRSTACSPSASTTSAPSHAAPSSSSASASCSPPTSSWPSSAAMTRSVRRLLVTADAIAEGDLDHDLGVRSRDEIGALAQAFERMVAYLREAADAAGRIASGDLTVQPTPRSERDVFGTAFATMAAQLRSLVGRLSGSATRLGAASQQMAATSGRGRPRRRGDRHRDGGHVARGACAGRGRRAHALARRGDGGRLTGVGRPGDGDAAQRRGDPRARPRGRGHRLGRVARDARPARDLRARHGDDP